MTLLLGFAAVNTGNNLLYLLVSALLGFMAVSGLLGQQNLQQVTVSCLPGQELYAGIQGSVTVKVFNQHRFWPVFLVRVEIAGHSFLAPIIPAGQGVSGHIPLTMARRGYQPLPDLRLCSCFPVNFFVRSRQWSDEQQLLVFPTPNTTTQPLAEAANLAVRVQESTARGSEGDIHSIGDYVPGDPLKTIHWKLSARQQNLKIKQLNRPLSESVVIDLDELPGEVEARLSQGSYLINHHYRQGRAVGLRLADRRWEPALGDSHRYRLLKALALYDPSRQNS